MNKSRFLTFLFSLLPGAGQMYLGYMKRGVSLMGVFFGIIAVAAMLNFGFLCYLLPIIWFYAFFDALNLRSSAYVQAYTIQDDFLFHMDLLEHLNLKKLGNQRFLLGGILCIGLGVYIVFQSFFSEFLYHYLPQLYYLMRRLPTLFIAIALIWLGIRLIRVKPEPQLFLRDEMKEYEDHD